MAHFSSTSIGNAQVSQSKDQCGVLVAIGHSLPTEGVYQRSKDDRRARVANRLQKRDSPCLKECIKKSQLKDQCGVSVALDALSSLKECV